MSIVSATLFNWVRRARIALTRLVAGPPQSPEEAAREGLIYRLKYWPRLPSATRTAEVLRLLSMMSHRPVNRRWMLSHTRMGAASMDRLLQGLIDRGAVEVIDTSRFEAGS